MHAAVAVERRLVGLAVAEAGRADRGAVAAGQAARGHLRPARVFEVREQGVAQIARRQAARLFCGGLRHLAFGPLGLGRGGFIERQLRQDRRALFAAGLDQKPLVQLTQRKVKTGGRTWAVAGGGTEAGIGRLRAVHGDEEQFPAPRGIVRVARRLAQEMRVLEFQRCEVAGAHADNRRRRHVGQDRRETDLTGGRTLHLPERFLRREQQRLQRLRAVGPGETTRPGGSLQAILAGRLKVAHAARKGININKGIVNDGAVTHLRADTAITLCLQYFQKRLKLHAWQEISRHRVVGAASGCLWLLHHKPGAVTADW